VERVQAEASPAGIRSLGRVSGFSQTHLMIPFQSTGLTACSISRILHSRGPTHPVARKLSPFQVTKSFHDSLTPFMSDSVWLEGENPLIPPLCLGSVSIGLPSGLRVEPCYSRFLCGPGAVQGSRPSFHSLCGIVPELPLPVSHPAYVHQSHTPDPAMAPSCLGKPAQSLTCT
jgi:hypothetical protein